jgi:hypothetical protein
MLAIDATREKAANDVVRVQYPPVTLSSPVTLSLSKRASPAIMYASREPRFDKLSVTGVMQPQNRAVTTR